MEKIKLSKVFPLDDVVLSGIGIFNLLGADDGQTPPTPIYPLVSNFINDDNSLTLDLDYEVGFSADKFISPLLFKLLIKALEIQQYTLEEFLDDSFNGYAGLIQTLDQNLHLIDIIYNRFGEKWKRIYDALLDSTYNPLHNYDVEEKRTPNITHTETFNNVQDQRTPNLTKSGSANATTGVFGFNGTTAKDSATNDGTSSESVTGTDTNVKTGNITNAETGTDTTTRKGNIGVTSSQQLIESELELRKHDFYRIIYTDIDSILCLKIY